LVSDTFTSKINAGHNINEQESFYKMYKYTQHFTIRIFNAFKKLKIG